MSTSRLAVLPSEVAEVLDAGKISADLAIVVHRCVLNSLQAHAKLVEVELDIPHLSVTIKDNGHGIPEQALQAAFHRPPDASQPGSKQGQSLARISQLCVLEVSTRAQSSFETHCRVIRGGTCLQAGLALQQQQRQGTTLVIR